MNRVKIKEIIENIMRNLDPHSLLSFLLTCKFMCKVGHSAFEKKKGWHVSLEQYEFLLILRKNIEDIDFDRFFYAGSSRDINRYRLETGMEFEERKEKCVCGQKLNVDNVFIEKEKGWVIHVCSFCSDYFDKSKKCRGCWKPFNGIKYIYCPSCRNSIHGVDNINQYHVKKCAKCKFLYLGSCRCDRGRVFYFGKHNGETIDEVKRYDPNYITWLVRSYSSDFNNPKSRFYKKVNIVIENIMKDLGLVPPS
jgi:hypothetical protein